MGSIGVVGGEPPLGPPNSPIRDRYFNGYEVLGWGVGGCLWVGGFVLGLVLHCLFFFDSWVTMLTNKAPQYMSAAVF